MQRRFAKPNLSSEQKRRIKTLYRRDNYHGFIGIGLNITWVSAAICLVEFFDALCYVVAIAIIGARQRALASLLHEAAHGTLFKNKALNLIVGRLMCGWTIFQSFGAYRTSHVLNHHPKIGDPTSDPDLVYMKSSGVYEPRTRLNFIVRYMLAPLLGTLAPRYVVYLLRDRLFAALRRRGERLEILSIVAVHAAVILSFSTFGLLNEILLYWYLPFLIVFPIVGWFSELAEHYPMMSEKYGQVFYSRNRYAAWWERIFIGMHGDAYHLTHHLLPGVPHWNLRKATEILKEDAAFRTWDDRWGGIFSSNRRERMSLLEFVFKHQEFQNSGGPPYLQYAEED